MAHLLLNPRQAAAFVQREAGEGVTQVVRHDRLVRHMGAEKALLPNVPVQRAAFDARDDERVGRAATIVVQVVREAWENADGAAATRLRRRDLALLDRLLDEDQIVGDVLPLEAADFGWAQAGVRDQADDDLVAWRRHDVADRLDLKRREGTHLALLVRQFALTKPRVRVDQTVITGGGQCARQVRRRDVDAIVRRARLGELDAVPLDDARGDLVDGDVAEVRRDPFGGDARTILQRLRRPQAAIVREPLDEPVAQQHRPVGVADLIKQAWRLAGRGTLLGRRRLDARVERGGLLVRGEAAGALCAVGVAVDDAPRTALGSRLVDAHGESSADAMLHETLHGRSQRPVDDTTPRLAQREGEHAMSTGFKRSDGLSEDCYTTSLRGSSSVGRASASQLDLGRSHSDDASPSVPRLTRTVEPNPRNRGVRLVTSRLSRCCTFCCTFFGAPLAEFGLGVAS